MWVWGGNTDGESNNSNEEVAKETVFEEVQAIIQVLEDNERQRRVAYIWLVYMYLMHIFSYFSRQN